MKSARFIKTLKLFWINENPRVHTAVLINCLHCAGWSAERSAYKTPASLCIGAHSDRTVKWKGSIDFDSAHIEKWKPGVWMFWGPTRVEKAPLFFHSQLLQASLSFRLCCCFSSNPLLVKCIGPLFPTSHYFSPAPLPRPTPKQEYSSWGCSTTKTATHVNPAKLLFKLPSGFWHGFHSFFPLSKVWYCCGRHPKTERKEQMFCKSKRCVWGSVS